MRKLMTVLGVLGVLGAFSISNAESIIGTGTISIQQLKDTIVKLIQNDTVQTQRIIYLEKELANLETQVAKLAEDTNKLAKKVASKTPHHYYVRHYRDIRHYRFVRHVRPVRHVSKPAELKVEHCTETSCPIPHHFKKEISYCATTDLNVHEGPGLNYKVIGVLRKGIIVSAMAEQGGWVEIPSPSGWVSASYLKECGHGRNEK